MVCATVKTKPIGEQGSALGRSLSPPRVLRERRTYEKHLTTSLRARQTKPIPLPAGRGRVPDGPRARSTGRIGFVWRTCGAGWGSSGRAR